MNTEQFTLYLPKEQKTKLKIYSVLTSKTVNDIIKEAIDEYLKNHPLKTEDLQDLIER
jgi:predicted DNA-binding protein